MSQSGFRLFGLALLPLLAGTACARPAAPVARAAAPNPPVEKAHWWQYGSADLDPLAERCDKGSKKSCADLAKLHERFGPAFDPKAACERYERACHLGDEASCNSSEACEFRARLHDVGRRLELPELYAECQAGTPGACGALSKALLSSWFRGHSTPELSRTIEATIAPAKKECAAGDLEKCTFVAFTHAHGLGAEQNAKQAGAILDRACRQGYFAACSLLGSAHTEGGFMPANEKRASDLFSRACEGGSAEGCTGLAVLASKKTSGKNKTTGKMFALACRWGDFSACGYAAHDQCPDLDRCSDEQARRASRFLNIGYENDDPDSTARLGVLLLRKDSTRAGTLLVRACNFGQAGACYIASRFGAEAEPGTPQNAYSIQLRQRACALGYELACQAGGVAEREIQTLRRAR